MKKHLQIAGMAAFAFAALTSINCSTSGGGAPRFTSAAASDAGRRGGKTSGGKKDSGNGRYNMSAPILPDAGITPGKARAGITSRDFCTPGYSSKYRNVPQSVKEQAYKNYGITHREKGEYEVDHLISLQLGGSNDIENLWPQSYKTQPWNAGVKDQLENAFHADICDGRISASVAQQKIARDWIAAYKERFKTQVPLEKTARNDDDDEIDIGTPRGPRPKADLPSDMASGGGGQVWVNLNSNKYWMPGTRYYGKTSKGKYQSEASAKRDGYEKAEGQ